jgi:hypothetical protein
VTRLPVAALLVLTTLAGCGTAATNPAGSAAPSPGSSGIVVARGHGWTSAGVEGPIPAPGTCHMRASANGDPLPDPACTPGVIDGTISESNLGSTLCRKGGYTGVIRPPDALSEPVKRKMLAAYGIPESQIGDFELDHLVAMGLGGASDTRNLWPEPNTFRQFKRSADWVNDKDVVETYLFHAICDGKVPLGAARGAMDADWTTAVAKLGLPPIPDNYQG